MRHFHEELELLKSRLVAMSGIAEESVRLAVQALLARDQDIARRVIDKDEDLDELELAIDDLAINLLALQQPMAKDLRFITSAMKIANDLERVGDHAVNIAECTLRLADDGQELQPTPELEDMARRARAMLRDALEAFTKADGSLGREVCKADDAVDALHNSVFRILLTHMMEDPRKITAGMDLFLVSGNIERIADLATNVAEEVVFFVEGRTIKHHAEKRREAR